MGERHFYVAINGGHSRSVAFATDACGGNMAVVSGPSVNTHTYHPEEVSERLESLFSDLASRLYTTPSAMREATANLVISLPGVASRGDRVIANACLDELGWRDRNQFLLVDDTWAGLIAGTLSYLGTCAFAGTGASVYVNESPRSITEFLGKPNKIDGWGPTIGDFGSGFQLATDIFRFFNREFDKGNTPPLFHEALAIQPRLKDTTSIQKWFDAIYITRYRDWRVKFAELSAAATKAADRDNPDPDARALVENAAGCMLTSISIALDRFPNAKQYPVVFQGGMFEHSRLYSRLVEEGVRRLTESDVYLALLRPVVGAMLIAMGARDRLPDSSQVRILYSKVLELGDNDRGLLLRPHGRAPLLEGK